MTDPKDKELAGLIKETPEAAWAAVICGGVSFLAINFGWWLIELPNLVNAHRDGLLLTGFAGSFGLVLVDVVSAVWAFRRTSRLLAAMKTTGNSHDEQA